MESAEARPVDPESIEPRRLISSDIRLHPEQLPASLADDQKQAVDLYIRHIVIRRVGSPESATNEAARLAVRFNDLYLFWLKTKRQHESFLRAMRAL